jgi:hypothetical protein
MIGERRLLIILQKESRKVSRKLRYKAIKFVLLDGRLFYKSLDGVLLECLGQEEAKKMMSEVHDGLCGEHQSAYRMKWVIRYTGCYWPTMLQDCFEYYKVRTMCGSRTGGWSLPCVMSD